MDENYKVIAKLMHEGASMDSPEVQQRVRIWHEQLYYSLRHRQSRNLLNMKLGLIPTLITTGGMLGPIKLISS